jgi:hypothetical protein
MRRIRNSSHRFWAVALLALLAVSSSGCVGIASQIVYMIKGNKVDAEFDGLRGKRVAVVCVANSSDYDPGSASAMLAQTVESILRLKVKGIKVVRQDEVADWIDNNNWNQMDYRDIGRGVNAEMVLAIDLDGYRLHEDQTLFKGRANVVVTVYDMTKGGEAVFRRSKPNFSFPTSGGQHVSETTEGQFQRKFIFVLANDIAKPFYDYDFAEDFARDASLIDQ